MKCYSRTTRLIFLRCKRLLINVDVYLNRSKKLATVEIWHVVRKGKETGKYNYIIRWDDKEPEFGQGISHNVEEDVMTLLEKILLSRNIEKRQVG